MPGGSFSFFLQRDVPGEFSEEAYAKRRKPYEGLGCEGLGNPERGRLIAADKALSICDELSEEMKQVDTGGLSFAELRGRDKYYVDKTLLIKDILSTDDSGVYLFTRPRRFGKTTNLTMLDAFFNEKYKGNTWFDGLEISKYPEYEKFKNAFPVIRLNLASLAFRVERG